MAHDRKVNQALAWLSRRQHGVFSRAQAVDVGVHSRTVDRRVNSGEWQAVDHGVYRVACTPPSWRQRLMAACLAGPAVASHRSAAALLGFVDCDEGAIEVTAIRHLRRHAGDVIWHESRVLDARDTTNRDGIPVTRPLRTLLDLGAVVDANRLEELLDDGLRRGWFSVDSISRRCEELGGRRRLGGDVIGLVLDRKALGQRPTGSILETRFRQLLRRAGLPEPVTQYEVQDSDGFVARVDFAYPDRAVLIEVDGEQWHTGRSPRARDARRDRRLVGLGFHLLRFYWDDIRDRPDTVVLDVVSAMKLPA